MNIIFDLDGTLSNTKHRDHFLTNDPKNKDWDSFNAACEDDTPLPAVQVLRDMVSCGHHVEIWSGRDAGERLEIWEITSNWLVKQQVRGIHVIMRNHGDHCPDTELKLGWLLEATDKGIRPDLVFEDRTRMVEFWRGQGIPCFQVAEGDF